VKQALFHSAVVQDLASNPLPPPHPELLKYFDPPKKVLKRARDALEGCKTSFKVKQGVFYFLFFLFFYFYFAPIDYMSSLKTQGMPAVLEYLQKSINNPEEFQQLLITLVPD